MYRLRLVCLPFFSHHLGVQIGSEKICPIAPSFEGHSTYQIRFCEGELSAFAFNDLARAAVLSIDWADACLGFPPPLRVILRVCLVTHRTPG